MKRAACSESNGTEELHNKIMCIDVVIKPAVGIYSANNEVRKHHSINGGTTLPTVDDPESRTSLRELTPYFLGM